MGLSKESLAERIYGSQVNPKLQGTTRGRLKPLPTTNYGLLFLKEKETRPCTKCVKEAEIHFDSLVDGIPPHEIEACSHCGHFGPIE